MADDDLLKHFYGGFVRMHILYHAAKETICGVEMIEELKRHGYKMSPGTLYPIECGESLSVVLASMQFHFKDAGKRYTERFCKKSKEECFHLISTMLTGDLEPRLGELSIEECWAKHDIGPPTNESYTTKVFRFDGTGMSRLVWSSRLENEKWGEVFEHNVPLGCVEVVFKQLHEILEWLCDWEESTRASRRGKPPSQVAGPDVADLQ